MKKLSELFKRYREIIMYLIFGVLTTFVGWGVYFAIFWSWKAGFGIPADDTTSTMYLVGYSIAQIVQWICAVLFAFFTNRAWVFTDADKNVPLPRQLMTFAGGRVATFFLDFVVTYFGALALSSLFPALTAVIFLGKERNFADLISKFVAAVIVIIGNYIFSKLLVFRTKRSGNADKGNKTA